MSYKNITQKIHERRNQINTHTYSENFKRKSVFLSAGALYVYDDGEKKRKNCLSDVGKKNKTRRKTRVKIANHFTIFFFIRKRATLIYIFLIYAIFEMKFSILLRGTLDFHDNFEQFF